MNSTKRESLSFAILVIFASLASPASLIGYSPQSVDDTKVIENLRAFAKLHGYVKYFHPSDEASRIDWDKFAVYGVEKVWHAKDKRNLNRVLEELFLPIAPTIRIYGSGEKPEAAGQPLPKERSQLKKVAWQHKGIGMGRPGPYLSVRTNRELPAGYGFGTITQFVDTGKYPGKEIKLRAYVRTNVSGTGNQGQLWLRVDTENRRLAFFDNMRDRPIKSREWKAYEIVGKVAEDAVRVVFGCFLRGAGKVWVDGFQLLIKNENSQWEPVEIDNSEFEEGESEPNGWLTPSPGYKYRVEQEGAYEGDRCLLIENARENNLFDKAPSIGQVINKKLGAGLHCQIPLALYSDENGTIGKGSRYAFEQLAAKLAAIDLDSLTAANQFLRLGDVVIAWNIFQHFYPYFDVVGVDWDAELTVTLRKALANKTENEFYFTLKELVAKLRDGHGRVYRSVLDRKRAGLPFLADWIEGRVTITASKDPDHFQRGDIVLSIDGVEAEEALSDLERYISGSPQWKRFRSAKEFGLGSEGSIVKLEIKRGDRIFELEVPRNQKTPITERERPVIEELQNEIYYVDLDQAEMPQINAKMDELERAKGVIFDLRGYPRGTHEIIRHLIDEPVKSAIWMVPQIIYPDRENIIGYDTSGRWELRPRRPRLKGKIVFVTDARAISYAESLLAIIEHYKLAEIVGQPTAGTNGNINRFTLPGGFRVTWTGMKVLKQDGSQHHLIGIQPTVPVTRTITGVAEGRDEYLEKALEIINR